MTIRKRTHVLAVTLQSPDYITPEQAQRKLHDYIVDCLGNRFIGKGWFIRGVAFFDMPVQVIDDKEVLEQDNEPGIPRIG